MIDKQLSKLPKKIVFCKTCVVSNQRPRVSFDKKGICDACNNAKRKNIEIDWNKRQLQLEILLEKHRSKTGSFDVIVPGSGGKDSSYVANILKEKYGMNPLCITCAPFSYTDVGLKNLNNFIDSGFNNIVFFPRTDVHSRLAKTAFYVVGDPFLPFIYMQKTRAFRVAKQHNIKLIFYGENGESEYGGSTKQKNNPFEDIKDVKRTIFKNVSYDELSNLAVKLGFLKQHFLTEAVREQYTTPSFEEIMNLNIQMHWMSYYRKWDPQENYYYSAKYSDFSPKLLGRSEGTYTRHSSLDDLTDGIHFYMSYIKFGMGRATRDAMTDIYRGHITRSEGVKLVRRYDGEFPKDDYNFFIDYCDLSPNEFRSVVNKYKHYSNAWKKDSRGIWKLVKQVT